MLIARILMVIGFFMQLFCGHEGASSIIISLMGLGLIVIASAGFIAAKMEQIARNIRVVIEDSSSTQPNASEPIGGQRRVGLPRIQSRRSSARRADEQFDAWIKRVAEEDAANNKQGDTP